MQNPEFRLQINAKALLQGPIINPSTPNLMNDDLRSGGFLPTTSPYADRASCNASVFTNTGNNAVVDWVWLSIRMNYDNQVVLVLPVMYSFSFCSIYFGNY